MHALHIAVHSMCVVWHNVVRICMHVHVCCVCGEDLRVR